LKCFFLPLDRLILRSSFFILGLERVSDQSSCGGSGYSADRDTTTSAAGLVADDRSKPSAHRASNARTDRRRFTWPSAPEQKIGSD